MEKIFLSQHRPRLLQRLSELETSMANIKNELIEAAKSQSSSLMDIGDYASSQGNFDTLLKMQERNINERREILSALHRIDKDTFGECDDCGNAISAKRLLSKPSALLCVECQQLKEAHAGLVMAVLLQRINLISPLTSLFDSAEVA